MSRCAVPSTAPQGQSGDHAPDLPKDLEVMHLRSVLLAAYEREKRLRKELEYMEQAKLLEAELRSAAVEGRLEAERRAQELQSKYEHLLLQNTRLARGVTQDDTSVEPTLDSNQCKTSGESLVMEDTKKKSAVHSDCFCKTDPRSSAEKKDNTSRTVSGDEVQHEMAALRHQIETYEHDFTAEHQQLQDVQSENQTLRQLVEAARAEAKRLREQAARRDIDLTAERQARRDLIKWVQQHRHEVKSDSLVLPRQWTSSPVLSSSQAEIDWDDLVPRDDHRRSTSLSADYNFSQR